MREETMSEVMRADKGKDNVKDNVKGKIKDKIEDKSEREREKKRSIIMKDGKIYFTKDLERKIFFVMTLAILIAGIIYRTGLL